ncbi:hypothetical protein BJY01DRAFT_15954 [Aspergillus pseudoustus]|uniref:Uncharacterized protein n=1 Tax=Aspergillus pseudoustus TaxID=1810923 RepID=A0ABR4JMG3_9EURO
MKCDQVRLLSSVIRTEPQPPRLPPSCDGRGCFLRSEPFCPIAWGGFAAPIVMAMGGGVIKSSKKRRGLSFERRHPLDMTPVNSRVALTACPLKILLWASNIL